MIVSPVRLPSQSPANLPRMSLAAPAATGTTIRMGFEDNDCAEAGADSNSAEQANRSRIGLMSISLRILSEYGGRVLSIAAPL